MIRRGNAKKTPSVVNVAESETLSVNKGIVRNSGPSDLASAVDSCNFRLRDDGSYALRKPDAFLQSASSGAAYALKDGSRVLVVSNASADIRDALFPMKSDQASPWLKYVPYDSGAPVYVTPSIISPSRYRIAVLDPTVDDLPEPRCHVYVPKGAKPIRAGDVTLIPAYVDTSVLTDAVDPDLYASGAVLPRYLSVYYDEDASRWVLDVASPEANTIVDDGTASTFKPNLMLDNPYAIRDLYGYGSVGVQGVVAYQNPNDSPAPDPSSSYVKLSQGSFSGSLLNALFGIDVKGGEVNVYMNAHASLAPIAMCMGPHGSPGTSDSLYEMDGEIVVQVGMSVHYTDDSSYDYGWNPNAKYCSSYLPAYAPVASFRLTRLAACVLTLTVYVWKADSNEATLYVYPNDVSVDELHSRDPRKLLLRQFDNLAVSIELDSDGNVVDRDYGFRFGLDDKGMYIDVDPDESSADLYSLSLSQFASDSDAAKAALPYSAGGKTYLDPLESMWTFYYYAWALPSGSSYYDGLDGVKVKDLTECVDGGSFSMVSRLNSDDDRPMILKAAMSFSKSMGMFYGVWETSDDGGVTWTVCPEFLRKNAGSLVEIPIVDQTYSQETLTSAGDYVKYLKVAPIAADDGDDLATDRVDVLAITQTPRTNTFRFTAYRYEKSATADALTPIVSAVPSVDVPQTSHAECPKRGSTYVVGTRMFLQSPYGSQGISLFVPDCPQTTGRSFVVKYAVTDDMSKALTDSDCSSGTALSPLARTVSGTGYVHFLNEESFVTNPGLTHAFRIRFATFVDGVAVAGMSVDAVYMYSSPSVMKGMESDSDPRAGRRDKFTAAPEPIVRVTSETGVLTHGGTQYPFGDYPMSSQDKFASTDGSAVATYSVAFTVTNPSNLYMLVAFCCNAPSRSFGYPLFDAGGDSELDPSACYANLTVDGVASSSGFVKNTVYRAVCEGFNRGHSLKYKLLSPGQSVSVTYSYRLATKSYDASDAQDIYVNNMIQALAFPLVVVAPFGEVTATAKAYGSFAKNPSDYTNVYFHAVAHSAYYGDVAYPHPAYDLVDYSDDLPSTYANGTLTKLESASSSTYVDSSYVNKAVAVGFRPYLPDLIDGPTEYADGIGFPKLTRGKSVYHEHRLLTYGVKGFENALYVSDPDSFVTPLQNSIEFSYGSAVTAVIPWRDYVMVFTENSTYMLLKDASAPSGYSSRTVNSQIGVPKSDGDSVQAILNGILFKAGGKAYVYVPGRYSTVDTMLNIRRVSDPIEGLLEEGVNTLSFVQDDEWHVFQKEGAWASSELVYDYAKGTWTRHSHPYFPNDGFKYGASWRMLMADGTHVVSYGKDYAEMPFPNVDLSPLSEIRYGDFTYAESGAASLNWTLYNHRTEVAESLSAFDAHVAPIPFSLDTGQKSSRFTVDKQFLEAKFSFMSLDDRGAFPLTLTVYANGMPHAHRIDANSDSPFWKESKTLDAAALSTTFGDGRTNGAGVVRQMFVKYSGRGKTVRITISGDSQSRFAVYAIDSRYRVLPNKQ